MASELSTIPAFWMRRARESKTAWHRRYCVYFARRTNRDKLNLTFWGITPPEYVDSRHDQA